MSNHLIESCTSYGVCGLLIDVQQLDWMTIGAVVLLIARLVKDVPDAYDAILERLRKRRESKDDQSN